MTEREQGKSIVRSGSFQNAVHGPVDKETGIESYVTFVLNTFSVPMDSEQIMKLLNILDRAAEEARAIVGW